MSLPLEPWREKSIWAVADLLALLLLDASAGAANENSASTATCLVA